MATNTRSQGVGGTYRRTATSGDAMPPDGGRRSSVAGGRRETNGGERGADRAAERESLKVLAFDSVGIKKYALQLQKARNGNPCLRIVEGVPQDDGTFRKFDLTIWSEDFPVFFQAMAEMQAYVEVNRIRTPEGHVWKPRARPGANGPARSAAAAVRA
jgi:hypothetical protein